MSLVPAQINLSWQSVYAGPHRVCYKLSTDPTYTCTVPGSPGPGFHPICDGYGAFCNYSIDIQVDNETCDQIDYDIYVQPACEDETSLLGRIVLSPIVSFIPAPTCKRWAVTCISSPVSDVTLLGGGSGYTNGSYTDLPSIGGGGTGATFDVTVAGGIITVIAVNEVGTGYTSAPTIDLTSISFTPGVEVTYTVILLGCTALTVYDCATGVTGEILPIGTFQPTEVYDMCAAVIPPIPADFSIVQDGNCLCECVEQNLINTDAGGTIDYTYIACNGAVVAGTLGGGTALGNICMVTGSLETIVNAPAVQSLVVVGPCDAV